MVKVQSGKMRSMRSPALAAMLAVLAILLIAIPGCGGSGGGVLPDPHTGSTGLRISFHQNSPPNEVDSGRSFKIIVDASNEGASGITGGTVTLTNIIDDEISIEGSKTKSFTLYGRSYYVAEGQKTGLVWTAKSSKVDADTPTKIGAAAEYTYQTNMTTGVCIDPYRDTDTTAKGNDKKSCEMPQQMSLGDQGAPVAAQGMELDIDQETEEVIFTITVRNVGGGEVVGGAAGTDIDQVKVAEVTLGGVPIDCDSSLVGLDNNAGTLRCHGHYTSDTAYTTSLFVKLDYVYRQTLGPDEITIQKYKAH
jgi:hypothetical protein